MRRKYEAAQTPWPCDKLRKTGNELHSTPCSRPFSAVPALTQWQASRRTLMLGALLAASGLGRTAAGAAAAAHHAIAMHGEPAWGADFSHPSYANPAARKGGQLVQGVLGTFDSLNPFIVKGLPAANIRGYVIESLLARGYDEPFTLYGLLADSVETDAARSVVTFTINPAARFADGKPVTPDDVIFSWELLRDKGRPNYRIYYVKVVKAVAIGTRTRALRSGRRRRPRIAADHRSDAGAGEARDQSRHVRGHQRSSRCSAAVPIP